VVFLLRYDLTWISIQYLGDSSIQIANMGFRSPSGTRRLAPPEFAGATLRTEDCFALGVTTSDATHPRTIRNCPNRSNRWAVFGDFWTGEAGQNFVVLNRFEEEIGVCPVARSGLGVLECELFIWE
jgi:hypothetical protein